ncbi:MAG: HAMP domain-containing sensor histidine kinase [bacterium]|nr:HAMP domain-containing sensor histidine kinase [bacterium]
MSEFFKKLNVIRECRSLHLGLWQCPPFLFVVMGFINILAMVGSYTLVTRFQAEPEVAALIVILVSIVILVLGNFIITGFNKVAEANRMKSEFVSIVSHQLRAPLAIFKWTLDLLKQKGAALGNNPLGSDPSYIEILQENNEKMIQMVNTLLEVSRIESNHLVLNREPTQLLDITRKTVQSFRQYAEASKISLAIEAPETLSMVIGDESRLRMVVQNLLDNAIRYSASGGEVKILIRESNNNIIWQIENHGVSIPPEQQKYIFQKFFRSTTALKYRTEGNGLGLYIVRAIIGELGGTVDFTSEVGKTTFWFILPVIKK